MDTGLSEQLEAVLIAHPGVTITFNQETHQWEAAERPTPTCMVLLAHATTLAELDMKLSGETP